MNKIFVKDTLENKKEQMAIFFGKTPYTPEMLKKDVKKICGYMHKTGHNIVLEVLNEDEEIRMNYLSYIFILQYMPEYMRHQQDSKGNTILHYIITRTPSVLEVLLSGVNFEIRNNEGLSAVEYGEKYSYKWTNFKESYKKAMSYLKKVQTCPSNINTYETLQEIITHDKVWLFSHIFADKDYKYIRSKYSESILCHIQSTEMLQIFMDKGLTPDTKISKENFYIFFSDEEIITKITNKYPGRKISYKDFLTEMQQYDNKFKDFFEYIQSQTETLSPSL